MPQKQLDPREMPFAVLEQPVAQYCHYSAGQHVFGSAGGLVPPVRESVEQRRIDSAVIADHKVPNNT